MTRISSSRSRLLLFCGASALTLLIANPAPAQTLRNVMPNLASGAGGARGAAATGPAMTTLPPLAQSALNRQKAVQARMATAMDLANQAQQLGRARTSSTPNGLVAGGLVPTTTTDSSLWLNANAPTQTTGSDGKTTVEIDQTAAKAILTWDSFNVGKNTTVHFDQTKGTQADGSNEWIALNRINDPSLAPSKIEGMIKAEGTVYLINRNGILFSGTSQVNTHSLVVSSLSFLNEDQNNPASIAAANKQFLGAGIGDPNYQGAVLGTNGLDRPTGDITIDAGAQIETKEGGFALIAGGNVINSGSIVSNGGQTVLFAGAGLTFGTSNATGRLVPTSVGVAELADGSLADSTVLNTGTILGLRGNITLSAATVEQNGLLMATSSITEPGGIHIEARSNGQGSIDSTVGGAVLFGPGSLTAVLPDANGETTSTTPAADEVFEPGSISVNGTALWFQHDATLYAPGAAVDLVAHGISGNGQLPIDHLLHGVQMGRVQLDDGVILSVAGLADVERPMSDNLVTVPRLGQNELADSPLQRDGILYKSPFIVDGRDSGARDDGLSWVGSPVANVGGYVQNTPRTVNELLVDGGSLSISNASTVVLTPGATLDVSGGYTQYLGGSVQTTRLIGADGRVYSAATADPMMTYVGFAGQTTVDHSRWGVTDNYSNGLMNGAQYESGYVQGGKGGSLELSSVQLILAGALHGDRVMGRYQIGSGREPQGASLSLNTLGLRVSDTGADYASLGADFGAGTLISTPELLDLPVNDIGNILWTPNVSSDLINAGGFGSVSLTAQVITVDANAALAVTPGGSINLTAGKMDVLGSLTAHAGQINLVSTGITSGQYLQGGGLPDLSVDSTVIYPRDQDLPVRGNIVVGEKALLDVSGLWVNDRGLGIDARTGDSFANGGSISIKTIATGSVGRAAAGDKGIVYDTTGSILLTRGSVLDGSGGGYVDTLGRVATRNGIALGRGGDVSLSIYADSTGWIVSKFPGVGAGTNDLIAGGRLEMDGTIKGYGLSGGGTLTLQALQLQIGGDSAGLPDYATYLSQDWFSGQGFGAYKLGAVYDATIADGATVQVSQRNYVADLTALANLKTGADLDRVATLGALDPFHRQATDFALATGTYLTWNVALEGRGLISPKFTGASGSLTLGEGATIQADAGAAVSLGAYGQLDVLGAIVAHGGSVNLAAIRNGGQGYDYASRSVWLGKNSLIDVSGTTLIDPFAAPVRSGNGTKIPVSGVVLDGGSVSIQGSNAFVVAEEGSRIDASGASAVLDIRTQSSNPFAPVAWRSTQVASNGGSIVLGATNGLYFDGTLQAAGGSAAARGGTLQIAAIPTTLDGRIVGSDPLPATSLLLQQSGDLVTDGMHMDGAIEGGAVSRTMHFAVDRLDGSGIDTLVLGDDPTRISASYNDLPPTVLDTIAFAGDVNLSLTRAVMMNARNYRGEDGAKVSIEAPYVALAGGGLTDIAPVLVAGDAALDVNARQIDLMGQLTLQRFGEANFTSSGDIRLMMPAELGYKDASASTLQRPGELVTAGDLTFKAGQIYPATGNVFLIAAPTEGSTVTFLGNGSVAPPISAGGALLVDAANIVQDGAIRAPSGTIQLGVGDISDASIKAAFNNLPLVHTSSVTLGEGSLTSVSLDGRSLPYGTTTDGADWRLVVENAAGTTTTLPTLDRAPEKLIGLAGDSVDFGQGATVDLSGGGKLYAQEWVPGTGGSRDLLNAVNTTYSSGAAATQTPLYADGREVYAVAPGYQAPVAAYDPSFGYTGKDQLSSLGKSVYLSGVPGLADGVYMLLPGQYATLPGAFRVVQQTGTIDSVPGDNVRLADGSDVVSGRFVDALTGKQDARTTSFLVQSQDVWKQYSEYTITPADTYFPGKAAHAGTSATRTPADAGRLVLAAVDALILDGALNAKAGDKGRGAAVDISAQAIQILGGSGEARNGYLQVDATSLSNLGAESLLIGGTRSDGVSGTTINAISTSVLLSNDSRSALAGPEVMLVTQAGGAGLVLDSGSVLAAKGDIANPSTAPILIGAEDGASGDGALVRVSNGVPVAIIRANVPGLNGVAGSSSGLLDIRSGASIQGGKSATFDSTGDLLLDPGASFSGDAIDVNANSVAFISEGSDATPTGFVVGDALLAQLANVGTLGLHSRSVMTFYGDVDLATKQSLIVGAATFVSDGGNVTITAPKLTLANDVGGSSTFAAGMGRLTLDAGELDFGAGKVTVQGFRGINATASQGIVGQGAGNFDFGDLDVIMTAPTFTVDSGANTSIKTTGALTLNRGAGAAIDRETLGGALSLSGGTFTTDATIQAFAGNVTLAATTGDLALLDGATLSTKGYSKTFFDTTAAAPGGNLSLTASVGAINVNTGATLDFSGSDKGGDAGSLSLSAAGVVTLDGALKGGAASGDYRGGRLTLSSGGAVDLDRLADLTTASGITGALSVTSGAGNLTLSEGKTLAGQIIYLAANGGDRPGATDGNVIVNGTIDVSGEAAGHIDLFGKSGVDVSGKLLATSSVAHQDGGIVTIGTTGVTDGTFNGQHGYENVQAADSGAIHIRAGALIDVSGGSADSGGQVSFRAPLLSDGDVRIAIDGGNANIKGANRVTIEPYAKWSTADAQSDKAKYFDGIIDPAGWYGADGKLLAGQWTDEKGAVLDAPADDDQLKKYLSKYYFTPTTANADHLAFFGYVDGDATKGPGALMGFTQAPGFGFGDRYAGIAGLHIRPGIELANPGETVNGGNIAVLTNWNLGAGATDAATGAVTLAYRYGFEAPVLTVRAEHNIDLKASITDGFYQQNDGAHLQDPMTPPDTSGGDDNPAYDAALAAYQTSKDFLDANGIWNGTIKLVNGSTADITADPYYEPIRAPAAGQSDGYYSNYGLYIGEIGNGFDGQWASQFNDAQNSGGFTAYAPTPLIAPKPAEFANYSDYASAYEGWLESNFFVFEPSDKTPSPLLSPIATDYRQYSADYATYIGGHSVYMFYLTLVGNFGADHQLAYAPFSPRQDPVGSPAYQSALAAYRTSKDFLDANGIWTGTIKLVNGSTADITADPYYEPIRAPAAGQSDGYYSNYGLYIGEIGNGFDGQWASQFNDAQNSGGFTAYAPTPLIAPKPAEFANYSDYASAYEGWLESNFFVFEPSDKTPSPLLSPIATDYRQYSADYATYIGGHSVYMFYLSLVGNFGADHQLAYAPFSPRDDVAGGGGGSGTVVPIAQPGPNNSPSNMPIAGRPTSLASATLLGGESSSYRLVAGADFTSANALAINRLTGAGSVSLDGHFEVVDTTTTDDAGNPLDPTNPAIGRTVVLPNVIRTGIGAIDIAAASDIALRDPLAPGAIYTGGEPAAGTRAGTAISVVRPAFISSLRNAPVFLATSLVQPDNGGDITLTAGGDILGNQQIYDIDGAITGRKGAYIAQYWFPWLNSGNQNQNASTINFGNFDQGVLSAGGNVSVLAGGDIRELSVSLPTTWYLTGSGARATQTVNTVGGGNLSVEAGGDILSGSYFVAKGAGRIDAGGSIGPSFAYQSATTPGTASSVSTILGIQDAQVQVTARGDLDIGRVQNPGDISFGKPFLTSLTPYSTASSLRITSVTGDIGFDTLNPPEALFGSYISGNAKLNILLPATLEMNALDGGITVFNFKGGLLYPSKTGQLSLLADGDIQLVGVNGRKGLVFGLSQSKQSTYSSILNPLNLDDTISPPSTLPTISLADIDGLLHAGDPDPVRIYSLTGDITDGPSGNALASNPSIEAMRLLLPKPAQIRAGRDIVNLVLLAQNLNDSDVTSIIAGRDIMDPPVRTDSTGIPLVTPGLIQLAGPGRLDIQAGRDLGPLARDLNDANANGRILPSTGIQTVGNLYNAYLPRESADISVLFGTGPGVAWTAFANAYLDPAATGTDLPSFKDDLIAAVAKYQADMDKRSGGEGTLPSLTADEAWAAFQTMPQAQREALVQRTFFKILQITGADEEDPNSAFFGKYARGYQAIEMLFPSASGYTKNNLEGGENGAAELITTGNLDIRGSTIQTEMGGDINIMGPGGQLLIGSTASPPYVPGGIGPQSQGILAWETGAVNIFSDQSVLLAQSRIFTERGGDMTIWSSNGDINAGKGSKTSSEIKPVGFICSADFYCRIDAASQVTGAGIAAFPGDPDAPKPTVTLAAPRGTVDFGDAGVRVAGNLIVAAQAVANADNVQVEGTIVGVPSHEVNVAANLSASQSAANAVQEATQAMQQARHNDRPSVITVTVDGFGMASGACDGDSCPAP